MDRDPLDAAPLTAGVNVSDLTPEKRAGWRKQLLLGIAQLQQAADNSIFAEPLIESNRRVLSLLEALDEKEWELADRAIRDALQVCGDAPLAGGQCSRCGELHSLPVCAGCWHVVAEEFDESRGASRAAALTVAERVVVEAAIALSHKLSSNEADDEDTGQEMGALVLAVDSMLAARSATKGGG